MLLLPQNKVKVVLEDKGLPLVVQAQQQTNFLVEEAAEEPAEVVV